MRPADIKYPHTKDPAVLKRLRRSNLLSHHSNSLFVETSGELSPGKQGVSETQVCACFFQDDGKGGLSLRGVAFVTVLAVLTLFPVLESTLPSFGLSYKIRCQ